MLHVCVWTFDVMDTVDFFGELNRAKEYIHIGMYYLIIDFRIAMDANNFIVRIN